MHESNFSDAAAASFLHTCSVSTAVQVFAPAKIHSRKERRLRESVIDVKSFEKEPYESGIVPVRRLPSKEIPTRYLAGDVSVTDVEVTKFSEFGDSRWDRSDEVRDAGEVEEVEEREVGDGGRNGIGLVEVKVVEVKAVDAVGLLFSLN
ncbi:hypothetical protein SESBI_28331 [Sesbania bispinosa]|nr:hypothetical protein SESBI_28331 [Sesbania bispinosa]